MSAALAMVEEKEEKTVEQPKSPGLRKRADDMRTLIDRCASSSPELRRLQRQAFEAYHVEVVILLERILCAKRSVAEEQAKTFVEQVTDQITRDSLTGLLRKDPFVTLVGKSFQEDLRVHTPAIIYADLNKFKPINDRFTHAVGDRIIKGFGDLLREYIRNNDALIARMGGDEFAIYLPNVYNPHTALAIADRIRVATREKDWSEGDLRLKSITLGVSIGVACLPEDRSGDAYGCADALINSADMLMLDAKRQKLERPLVSVTQPHGVLYEPVRTI